MKTFKILFVILILTTGCDRDPIETDSVSDIRGEYTGTFERNGEISNVELQFNNRQFTGTSEIQKFPAICKGKFSISGNRFVFSNECPWTAEFDWTLILNGEWIYQLTGDTLILTASNGDKYTLIKQ